MKISLQHNEICCHNNNENIYYLLLLSWWSYNIVQNSAFFFQLMSWVISPSSISSRVFNYKPQSQWFSRIWNLKLKLNWLNLKDSWIWVKELACLMSDSQLQWCFTFNEITQVLSSQSFEMNWNWNSTMLDDVSEGCCLIGLAAPTSRFIFIFTQQH